MNKLIDTILRAAQSTKDRRDKSRRKDKHAWYATRGWRDYETYRQQIAEAAKTPEEREEALRQLGEIIP